MNRRLAHDAAKGSVCRRPTLPARDAQSRRTGAFTLMEVMIAMAIFFMAIFAILELVASNLRNARLLEMPHVDCGLVMADLFQTNKLEEGTDEGDFGKLYPDYHWEQDIVCIGTNGLFQIQYILRHPDGSIETNLSALMWKPDSKPVSPKQ
jgi:hypothetical protein